MFLLANLYRFQPVGVRAFQLQQLQLTTFETSGEDDEAEYIDDPDYIKYKAAMGTKQAEVMEELPVWLRCTAEQQGQAVRVWFQFGFSLGTRLSFGCSPSAQAHVQAQAKAKPEAVPHTQAQARI